MKRPSRTVALGVGIAAAVVAPLAATVPAEPAGAISWVEIDPAIHGEQFHGWGTSLAWSANYTGDWANRDELADLLFSPNLDGESLGLTIARYDIGGGDNPASAGALRPGADVPGYLAGPDAEYDWTADPRQRWWLQAAKDRVAPEDFTADAIAYSAPYWMTVSQRSTGNVDGSQDNLLPGYEAQFADYLADVVAHFSEVEGIDFRVLSPLNEPSTNYWTVAGRQEGMHVSPGDAQRRILDATYEALQARGVETGLSAVDETSIDLGISDLEALRDAGFDFGRVDQVNVHTYSGGDRAALRQMAVGSGQKRLQMSEVTIGGGPYAPQSIAPSLALASAITTDMKELQPSEWVYWQALESEAESVAGDGNWGLVHYGDDDDESYSVTRKYSAMQQYSNFIRPGSQFVWNSAANAVTSLDEAGDALTIVVYNDDTSEMTTTFDLSAFAGHGAEAQVYRTSSTEERAEVETAPAADGQLAVTLPAQSISTFVIPVTLKDDAVIGNGGFERGAPGQDLDGWLTFGGDAYGSQISADYTQRGGVPGGSFEGVHYGGSDYSVRTYQTIDAPPGEYVLRAQARSNGGATRAVMVARTGSTELTAPIPDSTAYSRISIPGIVVTDGPLEISFETDAPGGRWVTFDDVTLERVPPPVSVSAAAAVRCVSGKAVLVVTTTNASEMPVALSVGSPYGTRSVASLATGASTAVSFTTRQTAVEGAAEVTASAEVGGTDVSQSVAVEIPATRCR